MAVMRVINRRVESCHELGERLVVGRDVECDVCVDDPRISRLHCLIERNGRDWVAVDLDSRNGTLISGWPLTRQTLKHGDVLEMGAASLQFLLESTASLAEEADRFASGAARATASASDANSATVDLAPDAAAVPRLGAIDRRASLWEQAMPRAEMGNKKRKQKRVKKEAILGGLHVKPVKTVSQGATKASVATHGSGQHWHQRSIPLAIGIPASVVIVAIIYLLANGVPTVKLGGPPAGRSVSHSNPHNND